LSGWRVSEPPMPCVRHSSSGIGRS
jgi:hypothetical protein